MFGIVYWKCENLTPDEQNAAYRGRGLWLHTGITGDTKRDCKNELAKRRKSGEFPKGRRTRIVEHT